MWFAANGYDVAGVEYRPKLVDMARAISAELRVDCRFDVADVFDLSAHRGFDLPSPSAWSSTGHDPIPCVRCVSRRRPRGKW
jgi:hypothetical protein